MKMIRIGTRGSKLALVQSEQVMDIMRKNHPDHEFELVQIKTTGDKILDSPLSKIGDKGLFTKEIENELLSRTIDLAVHSMKDMPVKLPPGLKIGAVTERLNPMDVFISKNHKKIRDMPNNAMIATGSLRRKAQLLASMPFLNIIDIRGNVNSRLKKMRASSEIDGLIIARAGLERLGILDLITETIPEDLILPAAGQASLAIEIRENDPYTENLIAILNHSESRISIECERYFLSELGGGCQVPVGVLARISGETITIKAMVAGLDGKTVFKDRAEGKISDHENIGRNLAADLMARGAKKILDEIYSR
jgi:hydroxymethylbilane synthase